MNTQSSMADFDIVSNNHAPDGWADLVNDGVDRHTIADTGVTEWQSVNLFITDTSDTCRGGLIGIIWGGWLHIKSIWVEAPLRGLGYGTRLLRLAERQAIDHNCIGATLDTHNAEAKQLYEKLGYETFARLDDFPPGRAKVFLRKYFAALHK